MQEGRGLEYLEYANEGGWIVADEDDLDDATIKAKVKRAMKGFDTAMGHVLSTDLQSLKEFTKFEDEVEDDEDDNEDDDDDDDEEDESGSESLSGDDSDE